MRGGQSVYKFCGPFSGIWPLVTFRKNSGPTGMNDTGLKSLSCPESEPIDCQRDKQTFGYYNTLHPFIENSLLVNTRL